MSKAAVHLCTSSREIWERNTAWNDRSTCCTSATHAAAAAMQTLLLANEPSRQQRAAQYKQACGVTDLQHQQKSKHRPHLDTQRCLGTGLGLGAEARLHRHGQGKRYTPQSDAGVVQRRHAAAPNNLAQQRSGIRLVEIMHVCSARRSQFNLVNAAQRRPKQK